MGLEIEEGRIITLATSFFSVCLFVRWILFILEQMQLQVTIAVGVVWRFWCELWQKSDSNGGDRQYQINAMWIEMVSGHSDLAGNEESVEIACGDWCHITSLLPLPTSVYLANKTRSEAWSYKISKTFWRTMSANRSYSLFNILKGFPERFKIYHLIFSLSSRISYVEPLHLVPLVYIIIEKFKISLHRTVVVLSIQPY